MTTENTESQIKSLIEEAKGHKALLDMAKLDYKHAMKKLSILASQYPALALKYELTKSAPKTETETEE